MTKHCPLPCKRTHPSERRWTHEKTGKIHHLCAQHGRGAEVLEGFPEGAGPSLNLKWVGLQQKGKTIQKEGKLGGKAKRWDRATLRTRVRLHCRSTKCDIFADVTFVLGARCVIKQCHLWKDVVCFALPNITACGGGREKWDPWTWVSLFPRKHPLSEMCYHCHPFPKICYINCKPQVTDLLPCINAKLLVLKPK